MSAMSFYCRFNFFYYSSCNLPLWTKGNSTSGAQAVTKVWQNTVVCITTILSSLATSMNKVLESGIEL